MSLGADYAREWLLGVEGRTVEASASDLHQVEHCRKTATLVLAASTSWSTQMVSW